MAQKALLFWAAEPANKYMKHRIADLPILDFSVFNSLRPRYMRQ